MSRLGERLKAVRNKKGMTKKQLGRKLGVSEKFIEELETGKKIFNDSLIKRASDILGEPIDDAVLFEAGKETKQPKNVSELKKSKESGMKNGDKEVKAVWNEAFASVLQNVPVYDYYLTKVQSYKQLPIVSNKVEGYPKDKVGYIRIQDDEMIGFRIAKGDLTLAFLNHEIPHNGIYLIEYTPPNEKTKRVLRQIKKLDKQKLLLVSDRGTLQTETVSIHDIKILARCIRLEITL